MEHAQRTTPIGSGTRLKKQKTPGRALQPPNSYPTSARGLHRVSTLSLARAVRRRFSEVHLLTQSACR
eukprot:6061876-Alexandrium_andersonii.AAC.1